MPVHSAPDWEKLENSAPSGTGETQNKIQDWLSWIGLGETNPFEPLDAGADPDLSKYLVRHDVFRVIWQDSPAIVFAPAGGGKSAFRVRLAYACRVEEDERRVFPITYTAPEPTATSLDTHLRAILKKAAQELLLALVYRPERFLVLGQVNRRVVRRVLDQNAPGLLRRFLPQVERAGGLAPLVETFDLSASRLTEPPNPYKVRTLCATLGQIPPVHEVPPPPFQRFQDLTHLLLHVFDFEAIYLLVDGVDAFPETQREPLFALTVLEPLLEQISPWAERRVFLKLFLPLELRSVLPPPLTKAAESATIEWESKLLAEVLRARLRAASRGRFDSLDAISAPSLRDAEAELLKVIPPIPRELLVLVNRVIEEHVRRDGLDSGLEPEDVKAAIQWYRSTQPQASYP